jgi:hypothetical protein
MLELEVALKFGLESWNGCQNRVCVSHHGAKLESIKLARQAHDASAMNNGEAVVAKDQEADHDENRE